MEELLRVEGIIRREAGLDLTFSDGRAGSLRFDLRGLRAGLFSIRIHPGGRSAETALRFNGALIERVGEGVFLPTIAHEYAHAVVFQMKRKAGRNKNRDDFRPHGEIWRSLMVLFGHPPERCHDYPVTPARRGKIFGYRCTDCFLEFRLGTVRHRQRRCPQDPPRTRSRHPPLNRARYRSSSGTHRARRRGRPICAAPGHNCGRVPPSVKGRPEGRSPYKSCSTPTSRSAMRCGSTCRPSRTAR